MGIMNQHFIKLDNILKNNLYHINKKIRVGILGFPNLYVSEDILKNCLGKQNFRYAKDHFFDDKNHFTYALPDILKTFYNCDITIFDAVQHRGIEIFINLNDQLPAEFANQFDCILDSSVLEHCFNVAQALKNISELLDIGGFLCSVSPIYLFNHGYFNINPLFYKDGLTQNGFEIIYQGVINQIGDEYLDFTAKTPPRKTYNLVVAKKNVNKTFQWPIQGKYLQ